MAEHLGKDTKTYADEYREFCRELRAFHDIRGTSFSRLPRLHGHEVDLYLLYSLVTSRGGWEKVNINGDWESLLPYFGIHRLCANGPIALKQIYVRYLDVYERIHFLGEEVDRRESELHEEDDARNRRKALRLLHATPTSYNASQHYVPDHVRSMPGSGLSTEAIQVTATERIFLSLLSPLPNEQDFAINVCSLLAMESRKPFPLHQCPRIVDALLAHAGVFSQVDLRDSFTESYRKFRGQDLARFWQDVVIDSDIAQLSEEDLLANQEKMNAAFDSYWTHLLHTSKETGEKVETTNLVDPDPEVATIDEDDEHFFARPTFVRTENGRRPLDDLETSLMGDDDEEEGEEEESQCSVGLYENGTGPPSTSQSGMVLVPSPVTLMNDDCGQPSFANCLSKTGNGIQSNENHLKVNSEDDVLLRLSETQEIDTLETSLGINTKETGEVEFDETNQAIAAPTAELTSDQEPISFLLDASVEKIKILPPRNRLPVANMKPDNPRAVRYWLDQRRTARTFPQQINDAGRELEGLRQCSEPEDWELFHGGREHGVHDLLGQRVLQVLNVIRNLSFDDANSSILAQSEACLRLLLLATHAKWSCLPQLAFDALSNMALDINLKDPGDCTLSAVLLGTVTRGLESSDRFIILRCMEIIGSLAQRGDHETLLMTALDSRVFERLCSYLTIPDVALLIYTLECVYSLSSLGQTTCNAFLLCQGTIDVLISLLTIEAQSYGSKARILMNVVETVAEGDTTSAHAQLTPMHSAMRPAYSNSPTNVPSTPPPALLQSAASPVPTTPASHTKILPKPSVVSRPDISSTSTVVSGTVSHTEKEQIAMQWLKTSFEPVVGATSIEQNALYRQYTTGCAKNGPKQVLGIVQFFSCVRATFGQNVGPFRKQVGNGVEFYFEGMSPRGSSASVVQVASISPMSPTPAIEAPGSPILKAQLCAPPKANNRKDILKPSLAHPHLSQALGPSGHPDLGSKISCVTNASGSGPPSSSLIKSLLANKVPTDASDANSNTTGSSNLPVTQVASLGLSPTATALPGMTKVPCMNSHVSLVLPPLTNPLIVSSATLTTSTAVPSSITIAYQNQVAQRQQQQKLLRQQQQVLNGPTTNSAIKGSQNITSSHKVNGFSSEILEDVSSENKVGGKGMLADLLEREVKKESINGAVVLPGKELRISDNGLELISKDARGRFAVDMGVVGMNNLTGVDLGDGAAAPKAAHLIAQVDDSGHVQIHLEEETDSSMCNGQSLLDQLEACQVVSSSSDLAPASECKAPKRPNPKDESECPTPKKALISNNHHDDKMLEKSDEATRTQPTTVQSTGTEKDSEKLVNGVSNGTVNPSIVSLPSASNSSSVAFQSPQPAILGPHAPRTFLILQPQIQNQQQNSAAGFQAQGQRLLLAIQRPGGVVQHVAMPANVVAISSSQLQTNGGVVTLTTTGGITTIVSGGHTLPAATSTVPPTSTLITTVASTSSAVVTTASVEGMVTFSGGAVAFPARPTENTARTSNLGDSHVTITPVSASSITSTSTSASGSVAVAAAVKKRTNSLESPKPRGRPAKSKSTDGSPTTPPLPTHPGVPVTTPAPILTPTHSASASPTPLPPFNPTHQYVCEWKDCMKAFKTPHEVYVHACYSHCPAHVEELGCLWEHCDGLKRRRFSMMTHLMDRHCNDEMQKILAARRLQMSTLGKTDIPAPQAPTPHPGYAPHAALHAIKRHAVELMNHKEQEEKEGPVTKSIRLTSALILRNLAIHSSIGRRILKRYEGHLASVALSNVESSRTVAQILFELTHHQSS